MVDKAVRKSSRQLLQRRVYKLPQRIFVTEEDGNSTTEACIGFLCKGPFGMRSRQKRVVSAVYQDAMWFNGVGDWLGLGDLDWCDLKTIALHIPQSEMFVVCRRTAFTSKQELQTRVSSPSLRSLTSFAEVLIRPREILFTPQSLLNKFLTEVNELMLGVFKIINKPLPQQKPFRSGVTVSGVRLQIIQISDMVRHLDHGLEFPRDIPAAEQDEDAYDVHVEHEI